MDEVLPVEQVVHWLRKNLTRGEWREFGRELPMLSFCRAVNAHQQEINAYILGKRKPSPRLQRNISRFIRLWESGLVEFGTLGKGIANRRRIMIRRETPKPRTMRFTVGWIPHAQIAIKPLATHADVMPNFRDVFGSLVDKLQNRR